MASNQLIDACNRHLNYLRISVTDRCNLHCTYCVPQGGIPRLAHEEILRYEEILQIVQVGITLGISKIRVTGGEPLVRKGVVDFLARLTSLPGLSDVSLTTNGVLLGGHLEKLRVAGIRRVNISLDTLEREKYRRITGHDHFDRVWRTIQRAAEMGFDPIKLNVVALRGINDDELAKMARLSFENRFHVRFIEYMPIGKAQLDRGPLLLTPEIKKMIGRLGRLHPVNKSAMDGPAQRYRFEGAKGEIGFIPAISHHFCDRCNRLRLTASGQLRPCLLSDHQEDVKGPLRAGCSDREIAEIFFEAVRHKPSDHNLGARTESGVCSLMQAIGG
jgi:cyclic pyranopterin phosphate synthase